MGERLVAPHHVLCLSREGDAQTSVSPPDVEDVPPWGDVDVTSVKPWLFPHP